jgi:1,4-dihydroxy-6-naphthoate synthase
MKLSLGFSPCPNDTFIFDALVNKKIDTEGLDFEVFLEDVQTLNEWAIAGKLDISKISYGVLPQLLENYCVLSSGGALGKGAGPLLISKKQSSPEKSEIEKKSVAVPGKNTTANLLFSLAYPDVTNKKFMIFSEIENAVLKGEVDYGVIIHENRFTYQAKGLYKVIDLGDYWELQTGLPIPLGGIVAKKSINKNTRSKINRLIRQSVEYAFKHYPAITGYVQQHAQEMSEAVMRQHIDLYVNDFSIDLGEEGRNAINKLLSVYQSMYPEKKVYSEIYSE